MDDKELTPVERFRELMYLADMASKLGDFRGAAKFYDSAQEWLKLCDAPMPQTHALDEDTN